MEYLRKVTRIINDGLEANGNIKILHLDSSHLYKSDVSVNAIIDNNGKKIELDFCVDSSDGSIGRFGRGGESWGSIERGFEGIVSMVFKPDFKDTNSNLYYVFDRAGRDFKNQPTVS